MRRKTVSFTSEIRKVGNGYFLGIPKKDVDKMKLEEGDDVNVTVTLPEMVEDDQ